MFTKLSVLHHVNTGSLALLSTNQSAYQLWFARFTKRSLNVLRFFAHIFMLTYHQSFYVVDTNVYVCALVFSVAQKQCCLNSVKENQCESGMTSARGGDTCELSEEDQCTDDSYQASLTSHYHGNSSSNVAVQKLSYPT